MSRDFLKSIAIDTGPGDRAKPTASAESGSLIPLRKAQAVILSPEEYGGILEALRGVSTKREADLVQLRHDFDARLSILDEPDASDRLRRVLREPIELGEVRAGESY